MPWGFLYDWRMDRIAFEAAVIVLLAGILLNIWAVNYRLIEILKRLDGKK